MRYKWFVIVSVIAASGCQNMDEKKSSGKQLVIPELQSGVPEKKLETKYAFIRKIDTKDGKNYIQADYADYLTGEKALQKARAAGDAHYVISKSGDTTYSLVDGYYISNTNASLRTLELSEDISIEVIDYSSGRSENKSATLSSLKSLLKNDPLMILSITDGMVTGMKEQYRP